jgi:hypothetical protein
MRTFDLSRRVVKVSGSYPEILLSKDETTWVIDGEGEA